MKQEDPVWNLSAEEWATLMRRAGRNTDVLEDGAFVRPEPGPEGIAELTFWATTLNKPEGFAYPFLEPVPKTGQRGASIGRVWHEAATGFVQFEVWLPAAAQALAADYESGASDLDWVTYEQAAERAVRGTAADLAWLHGEFARLLRTGV